MEPASIIQHVHQRYRSYWREERKLTREAFEGVLQPHVHTLTPTQYTRLTSGKVPVKLLPVLQIPAVQQSIERALACPGLFSCTDERQVDWMLAPKVHGVLPASPNTEPSHVLLAGIIGQDDPLLLSNREKRVAKHLLRQVMKGSSNILCWTDPPPVGAAFLAFAAAATYLPREGIRSTFLLQPFCHLSQYYLQSDGAVDEQPDFDRGLAEVAEKLGLAARPSPKDLLKALKASRSVLFILQADAIRAPERNAPGQMQSLLREARSSPAPAKGELTPLVLIGRPPTEKLPMYVQLMGDQNKDLAFGTRMGERFEFFETQWRRFSSLRGNVDPLAVDDNRLKRAEQYYTKDGNASMWPSHLRMLAFFASNNATLSYFDPTAGWDRIAGMGIEQIPIDIRLHLSEAIQLARTIPEGHKRKTHLRVARWCSTAVYWLTEEAAEDLGRLKPQTDFTVFSAAVHHLDRVIEVVSRDKGKPPVYKMDIALRAVIQQRWAVRDPFARAETHYQVAYRLYKSRDNKDLLHVEFPVEPHWGRSRIHFLAECLRHLIRACDRSVVASTTAEFAPEHAETFPKPPTSAMRGCDPRQVINFCFGEIYWKELNGNGRLGTIHRRKLALRHGAYQLTAELLQLMSHEQRLGEPHPALNPAYALRYLREVGYAQLDLGDLASARRTFEKLLKLARDRDSAPEEILQYLLDLTIVQGAMNDLVSARKGLLEARALAPRHADPDSDRKSRITFKTVTTRLDAREANLLYLEGDLKGALQACERIETLAPNSISRDVAHVYIATLGALSAQEGQDYLQRAMCVCVRNLFDNTSDGMNHTALGFRVALAHAFRKQRLLNVAEEALDQVYKDVLKYGCSERTYLAMLLEAGRTVLMLGRPARAYAAYFRPCLDRASQRGHARTAAAARKYSRECIMKLLDDIAAGAPPSSEELHMQLKGNGEYLQAGFPAAIDPKFSYGIAAAGHWVSRLSSKETLEAELANLSRPA